MGEPRSPVPSSEVPPSFIATLDPWDFWCRDDAIGLDDETRRAMRLGTATEHQRAATDHLIRSARESLVAIAPMSTRAH